MASPRPVIRNGWSASTLLAGINCLDQDCLRAIKEELPDNPDELAKLHEVSLVFFGILGVCKTHQHPHIVTCAQAWRCYLR